MEVSFSENKEKNYGFFRPTEEVFNAWKRTKEMCEALNSKIVVFQCPASFRTTDENVKNMTDFFSSINRTVKNKEYNIY